MRFPFRKVVYAVSLVAVVWIFLAVVLFVEGRHFELNSAQAIVVLGARVKPNGNASFALQARVEHAVNLCRGPARGRIAGRIARRLFAGRNQSQYGRECTRNASHFEQKRIRFN
jgi:hypothetical protein